MREMKAFPLYVAIGTSINGKSGPDYVGSHYKFNSFLNLNILRITDNKSGLSPRLSQHYLVIAGKLYNKHD